MGQKTYVTFSADLERDRDILAWLKRQEKGHQSAAIREALRKAMSGGITMADVLQAVRNLERKVKAGAVIVGDKGEGGSIPDDEPADVAAALDALADL